MWEKGHIHRTFCGGWRYVPTLAHEHTICEYRAHARTLLIGLIRSSIYNKANCVAESVLDGGTVIRSNAIPQPEWASSSHHTRARLESVDECAYSHSLSCHPFRARILFVRIIISHAVFGHSARIASKIQRIIPILYSVIYIYIYSRVSLQFRFYHSRLHSAGICQSQSVSQNQKFISSHS